MRVIKYPFRQAALTDAIVPNAAILFVTAIVVSLVGRDRRAGVGLQSHAKETELVTVESTDSVPSPAVSISVESASPAPAAKADVIIPHAGR